MEFDWFAVDAAGNIGAFCFGGYGFIPEEVLANHEAHTQIAQEIELPYWGSEQIWNDYAEHGIFVYDWQEYDGPYRGMALPNSPLSEVLRNRILGIEGLPTLCYNFHDTVTVSEAELDPSFMQKTALLAGATGLVGAALLPLLLADARYAKVLVVGRRPVALAHPKLEQVVAELDDLESHRLRLIADDVFCCLGTTQQQAGSKAAFHKVDFLYVVRLAALAASNFAGQFLVVSSLGANAASRVHYSWVKGEMEAAVRKLPFRAVHIFRPSLLLGQRARPRLGERVAAAALALAGPLLRGGWAKYRPVAATAVAAAMLYAAKSSTTGVRVHEAAGA